MDLGIAELIKKQNLDLLDKYSQYIEEIYDIKLDRDFQKFFNNEPKSINKNTSKNISNTPNNKKKKKIIRKKKEEFNIKTIETFPEGLNPKDNPIKKKKIIRKPAKVKSIYEKFVDYCLKHDIKYFKYKNNFNWIGPAFIIDKENQVSLDDIRQETQIKLNYEQFALTNYIVYPKQLDDYTKLNYPITMPNYNEKDSSLDNDNDNNKDEDSDETIVIEWNYKGNMYYCQEDTGDVYNQNEEYIGKRTVKNGKYILNLSC